MEGLSELKVKESDRLAATSAGLAANGVPAKVEGDNLIVGGHGVSGAVRGGGTVAMRPTTASVLGDAPGCE